MKALQENRNQLLLTYLLTSISLMLLCSSLFCQAQGGDPTGTGRGGEGAFERQFKDEFHNSLRHDSRGVLAMANSGPNTNASQFYLTFAPCPHLDNKHSVFGRVVGGMETLDALEKVPTEKARNAAKPKDCPLTDVKITAVTIYANPLKAEFVPRDELTGKKANEVEKKEEEGEMGAWFSNPAAASASSLPAASGDSGFKYLNIPAPSKVDAMGAAISGRRGEKRKEGPTDADSSAPANKIPAAAADELDPDAAAFEAMRRQQAAKAAQSAGARQDYGNFSNW